MDVATTVRILPLSIAEVREHGERAIRLHYEEVAKNKHLMVLDPDWDRYLTLESLNKLICIGAWEETPTGNELVGYSITLIDRHLHYVGLTYAANDVLFLRPDRRDTGAGRRLIAETERLAKARGARMVTWHAKKDSKLERLLSRTYGVQDIIFSKEL